MASDALLSALQSVLKKLPKELQNGDVTKAGKKLESTLKNASTSYASDIDNLKKAIAKDKKAVAKNKDAIKELDALAKAADDDEKVRLTPIDKSTKPV